MPTSDVTVDLEELRARVSELERRLSALEGRSPTHTAGAEAPPAIVTPALSVVRAALSQPSAFSVFGKAVLGIAGAYLLRAAAEFRLSPHALSILSEWTECNFEWPFTPRKRCSCALYFVATINGRSILNISVSSCSSNDMSQPIASVLCDCRAVEEIRIVDVQSQSTEVLWAAYSVREKWKFEHHEAYFCVRYLLEDVTAITATGGTFAADMCCLIHSACSWRHFS